jgi:hypothetical protein
MQSSPDHATTDESSAPCECHTPAVTRLAPRGSTAARGERRSISVRGVQITLSPPSFRTGSFPGLR